MSQGRETTSSRFSYAMVGVLSGALLALGGASLQGLVREKNVVGRDELAPIISRQHETEASLQYLRGQVAGLVEDQREIKASVREILATLRAKK